MIDLSIEKINSVIYNYLGFRIVISANFGGKKKRRF